MKEQLVKWRESVKAFWKGRSKREQTVYLGAAASILVLFIVLSVYMFSSNERFVPLYSNLSIQETSQITAELDSRGVPYELQDGGTTVTVPEPEVDRLLVDLAGQGIPKSGNIDYSFFSENSAGQYECLRRELRGTG
jgi:flagellar M-ring protein FliF